MRELHRRGARMVGWFLGRHDDAAGSFFEEVHVRDLPAASRYARAAWGRAWGTPFSYGRYYDPLLQEVLPRDRLLYVDHLHMAVNVPPDFRHRYWLDDHNLEHVLWEEYAAGKSFPLNRLYSRESELVRRFEWESIADSAATSVPSDRQREGLPGVCRDRTVVVPNGVSDDWLAAGEQSIREPLRDPGTLGFIGGYDWPPNREAVNWLFEGAWETVVERTENSLRLVLAGRSPDPDWKEFENVTVMGYIGNSETFFSKVDVLLVPLRMGSGTRIKILEAAARGVPVITTIKGCEGLSLPGLVRVDSRSDYVGELVRALGAPDELDENRRRAHRAVRENYRWEDIGEVLWEQLGRRRDG